MKNNLKIFLILLIAGAVLWLSFESVILVSVARNGIKHILNVGTHMEKIALRPLKGSMAIKGFKIFNPSGYREKVLASISLILLDFKPKTFFEPGAYFDKIEIHVDKLNIIRDKEGVINLARLESLLTPQEKSRKPFLADKYVVEIEKVYYIDRRKEEGEQVKEIVINKRWEYDKVEDPDNMLDVIAFKVFVGGGMIATGLEIQELQKRLAKLAEHNKKLAESIEKFKQENIEKAKQAIREQVDITVEAVKEGAQKTKEAVGEQLEETKEAVKEKVEDVKDAVDRTTQAVGEQAEKTVEAVKEKAEDVKESAQKTKKAIDEKIEDIKETIKENTP